MFTSYGIFRHVRASLSVTIDDTSELFSTTLGTPQEDSLSPVLFIIYLEAALRDFRIAAPPKSLKDAHLPPETIYADDVDFISHSQTWLQT